MKNMIILEDESERERAMTNTLSDLEGVNPLFFDNVLPLIAWLKANLPECALISLDHDLGRVQTFEGVLVKPGAGWDVVEYLVTQPPACPVVLHSANREAVVGMKKALEKAKWNCRVVTPYPPDLDWVSKDWLRAVKNSLSLRKG